MSKEKPYTMAPARKTVDVVISLRVTIDVPYDWTNDDVLFHLNDSSHCLRNEMDRVSLALENTDPCVCCEATLWPNPPTREQLEKLLAIDATEKS